jgi:hypothetical protein
LPIPRRGGEATDVTADELELIRTVAADLRYLKQTLRADVDNDTLRRVSTTLRLLLAEGAYGRAWRAAGFDKEPEIPARELRRSLGYIRDLRAVNYAQAGGGSGPPGLGMRFGALLTLGRELTAAEREDEAKMAAPLDVAYRLSEFLASPSVIIEGLMISRQQVIQYVANKLGGAHLDFKRDPQREPAFLALDRIGPYYGMTGRPAVYFELLSIGQAVAYSRHAWHLCDRAAQLERED